MIFYCPKCGEETRDDSQAYVSPGSGLGFVCDECRTDWNIRIIYEEAKEKKDQE